MNNKPAYGSASSANLASSDDTADLKKKITELELENRRLKGMEGSSNPYGGSGNFASSANFSRAGTADKNWMSFNSGGLERPTTAAAGGSSDVRRL